MSIRSRAGRSWVLAALAGLAAVALVVPSSAPAQVVGTILDGHTKLILDRDIASAMAARGIRAVPIEPGEQRGGGITWPIAGGRILRGLRTERFALRGRWDLRGGMAFVSDTARVDMTGLVVQWDEVNRADHSGMSAVRDGHRMSFVTIARAGSASFFRNNREHFRGERALLTRETADVLNQAFATDIFRAGERLGELRHTVKLRG